MKDELHWILEFELIFPYDLNGRIKDGYKAGSTYKVVEVSIKENMDASC